MTSVSAAIYHKGLWQWLAQNDDAARSVSSLEVKRIRQDPYVSPTPAADILPRGAPKDPQESSPALQPPSHGAEATESAQNLRTRLDAYRAGEQALIDVLLSGKLAELESFSWQSSRACQSLAKCRSVLTMV